MLLNHITGRIDKDRVKNRKKKKKYLFFEESLFFRVVFAFVDSQLSLRFDAASFACVFAP